MTRHMLWIDGEWLEGTRTHTIKSPYGEKSLLLQKKPTTR